MTDPLPLSSPFLRSTVEIVASFVGNHALPIGELPDLIQQVHDALSRNAAGSIEKVPEAERPAVPIKKSIQPDYLICLNDGKRFKSLKRHLRTQYGLSPDEYRAKWGLAADYPMVAPGYARERSQMAKEMGLGQQRRRPL